MSFLSSKCLSLVVSFFALILAANSVLADYTSMESLPSWLDTKAGNSMEEDATLFDVVSFDGADVIRAASHGTNIHSHFMGANVAAASCEYSGRMYSGVTPNMGVTFASDYPNKDAYYRLRVYNGGNFELNFHGKSKKSPVGNLDSGVASETNTWFRFRVRWESRAEATYIRAKVWNAAASEPNHWQIHAEDFDSKRYSGCRVGLWSMKSSASQYWDELSLTEETSIGDYASVPGEGLEAHPTLWFDTYNNNGNPLFPANNAFGIIEDSYGDLVHSSFSDSEDIHNHFIAPFDSGTVCSFSGAMEMPEANTQIGVTVASGYPNTDRYYGLIRDTINNAFHLISRDPASSLSGVLDTALTPLAGQSYQFKIQWEDLGASTQIKAKVWKSNQTEPVDWLISAVDDNPNRYFSCRVGLWSSGSVGSRWNQLSTQPVDDGGEQPSNLAPSISSMPITTGSEGSNYSYTVEATDPENDTLSYTLNGPDGMSIDDNGLVTWEPDYNTAGSYSVTVTATDPGGATDQQSYTLYITNINQPPVVQSLNLSTLEDQSVMGTVDASDPDGDTLSYTLVAGPVNGVVSGEFPQVIYQPNTDYFGTDQFTVSISDGTDTVDMTVGLTVTEVNDAPIITSSPLLSINENAGYEYAVLAIDAENTPLTFELETAPEGMSISVMSGVITWLPDFNAAGIYPVIVTVSDGQLSTQHMFSLEVLNVNQNPKITSSPELITSEGSLYLYNILAIDPDNEPLNYSLLYGPIGMGVSAEGVLQWTVGYSSAGTHSIQIEVSDGLASVTQEFTITVGNSNQAPVTQNQSVSTLEDHAINFTLNATDFDNDVLQYVIVEGPTKGELLGMGPNFTYTPFPNVNGDDLITFKVNDGMLDSNESQIFLVVDAVNDAPVIESNPILTAMVSDPYTYALQASDIEGSNLTFQLLSGPEGMSINNSGVLTWNPLEAGSYFVEITVSDGASVVNQDFDLVVVDANQSPTILSSPVEFVISGQTWNYDLLYSDPDDDEVIATLALAPENADLDEFTNVVSWETGDAQPGTYQFEVLVDDMNGGSLSQSFSVEVLPLQTKVTNSGKEFWLPVPNNFDNNSGEMTFFLASSDEQASVSISAPLLQLEETVVVNPGEVVPLSIPILDYANAGGLYLNKRLPEAAVNIYSDVEVSVFGLSQRSESTDGFVALPVSTLGKKYMVGQFQTSSINQDETSPIIDVVSTDNDTVINIIPAMDLFLDVGGIETRIPMDDLYSVNLNKGDVFKLQAKGSTKADLSGTIITSNKNIAVFTTHSLLALPMTAGDFVIEQMIPISSLGTNYLTAPMYGKNGDTFRLVATQDDTLVYSNNVLIASLDEGEPFSFIENTAQQIVSSKPILLLQFSNSTSFNTGLPGSGGQILPPYFSDPSMLLVSAKEQYLNNYLISTPVNDFGLNYFNVIVPNSSINSLKINGEIQAVDQFSEIPGSGFSFAQIPISPGVHFVSADESFGLTVYGYDTYESYLFNGGMQVGNNDVSTKLTLEVTSYNLKIGNENCIKVKLSDLADRSLGALSVNISVEGASNESYFGLTDINGYSNFCYVGTSVGIDEVTVSAANQTEQISIEWQDSTGNINPVISSTPYLYYSGSENYVYEMSVSNSDEGSLVFEIESDYPGVNVSQEGVVTVDTSGVGYVPITWWRIGQTENLPNKRLILEPIDIHVSVTNELGFSAYQSFRLTEYLPHNTPPKFEVEKPNGEAVVGVRYVYDPKYLSYNANDYGYRLEVSDYDGDKIYVSLANSPEGASLDLVCDEVLGYVEGPPSCVFMQRLIDWTPMVPGIEYFEFEIFDSRGSAVQVQNFSVEVLANLAPELLDLPTLEATELTVGSEFSYVLSISNDVPFTTKANLDNLRIIWESVPLYLSAPIVDVGEGKASFQLMWTPTADDIGIHTVKFRLADQVNESPTYEFALTVSDGNLPPVFTSSQIYLSTEASIGLSYSLSATDGDDDPLIYSLVYGPEGLQVDEDGSLNWTPSIDLEKTSHSVLVRVSDGKGGFDYANVNIHVSTLINQAPKFDNTFVPNSAKMGIPFQGDFTATDREGSAISYSVTSNMPLDSNLQFSNEGVLTFTPTNIGEYWISLRASDVQNATSIMTLQLSILDPTNSDSGLVASMLASPEVIQPGESAILQVIAENVASVPFVTYFIGSNSFNASTSLEFEVPSDLLQVGSNLISAIVDDGFETSQVSTIIYVSDIYDNTPPELAIHSPAFNSIITDVSDVVISAGDHVVEYALYYRRMGTDEEVELLRHYPFGSVLEQKVTEFDPTTLLNGTYHLILEAIDANQNVSKIASPLILEGALKVGHLQFTLTDISIPLEGMPISVNRSYDSRRRNESLDFGFGWEVDYQSVRIEENHEPSIGWTLTEGGNETFLVENSYVSLPSICVEPSFDKIVSITLPNGDVNRFKARARPVSSGSAVSVSNPYCYLNGDQHIELLFDAAEGTTSTLESTVGSLYLSNVNGGDLVILGDTVPVKVENYILKTQAGFKYYLNQTFGVSKIETPNGHTVTYTSEGIFHSSGKSVTFQRDAQGRIEKIIDPAGNELIYTYDGQGDLRYVQDQALLETPALDYWEYTYQDHYLEDMIDPLGRKLVKNLYDDEGRLYAQENSDGVIKTFDHDLDSKTSIVTDLDGRSTHYAYDGRGNVLTESQLIYDGSYSSDIVTTYTYDGNDNQETRTIGTSTWTSQYDAGDNLTYAEDPEGHRVNYLAYNDFGQETQIQDELGRLTVMDYDTSGNLETIHMPAVTDPDTGEVQNLTANNVINAYGLVESTTDLRGYTTGYVYYPEGHVNAFQKWKEYDAGTGQVLMTYTYDTNNNVKTETRTRTVNGTEISETLEYDYDARNRLTHTHYPDGSYTQTDYDLAGNVDNERDRFGEWTDYTYDVYGRLTNTVYPDGSSEQRTYTNEGLLETVTDRMGRTTTSVYDDAGRLWKTVFHDGSETETRYTPQGWVQYEWDEEDNLTEYEYDKAGRRKAVIRYLDGAPLRHEYEYYDNGELHTETDALLHTTTYVINELDQRIQTQFHNGTHIKHRYDPMGARTKVIDQRNVLTDYRYDERGRLWQVQPDVYFNNVRVPNTEYSYDEVGNKLTQTDANGHATTWTYDYFGRVLTRELPEGQMESFVYNDSQRSQTHTDFNGVVTITYFDVMGRVSHIEYQLNGETEHFTYWNNDQVKTVTDQHGTTEYYYDARDRLDYQVQPDGTVLDYSYDNVGNRTEVKLSHNGNDHLTTYHYDDLNRLQSVIDSNGTTSYSYDDVGNLDTLTYPNGIVLDYDYNSVNQLDLLTIRNGVGAIVQSYDYGLNETGRRDTITEANGRFTQYQYDDLYRLTDEQITDAVNGNYSASYLYDWVGNRDYSTVQGVQTDYVYDANDRLQSQGGTTYVYDNNGNLKTETLDGNITAYHYNHKQKMVSVEYNGSETASYQYDHTGIRTAKSANAQTTHYIVDANRDYAQVLLESTGADAVQYSYGHDLISQKRSGAVSYYHYDGLGSTRALSDATGTITDSYHYEAFGEIVAQEGTTENGYLFTGEQFDASLDQYYLRARYYDQGVGRFTQRDTWMGNNHDPVTLHKYLYANADPAYYTDPTGNFSIGSVMSAVNVVSTLVSRAQTAYTFYQVATGEQELSAKQIGFEILAGMGAGKLIKMFSKKFKGCKVGNSFVEGTLVSTPNGLVPIEEIEIGDLVFSYDEESGKVVEQEVIHLIRGDKENTIVSLQVSEEDYIRTTGGHPFFVLGDNSWIQAEKLTNQDLLVDELGEAVPILGLSSALRTEKVFNLTVANTHTYYVGENKLLAHNSTCRIPHRAKPRLESGNDKEGLTHIRKRHTVGGDDPSKQGDLFAPGTSVEQITQAVNKIVAKGKRISDPGKRIQTFEKKMVVNGKQAKYRVVVDSDDGNRVITAFPAESL